MLSEARRIAESTVKPPTPRKAWKRTPDEDARIYGPPEFRTWLHQQPCAVCGWKGRPTQMQQAHAKTGGTSKKDDWTRTLPLCDDHFETVDADGFPSGQIINGCHRQAHRGVKSFEAKNGVRLLELAAKTQQAWALSQGNHDV